MKAIAKYPVLLLLLTVSFCVSQRRLPRPNGVCAGCPVEVSTYDHNVRKAAFFVINWLNSLRPVHFLLYIRRAQSSVSIFLLIIHVLAHSL